MTKNVILRSPVYSEILVKIGEDKVYSRDFIKRFLVDDPMEFVREDNDLIEKQSEYSKQIPTLHRQLTKLQQEGFLGLDEGEEDGKKHEKNKKYFFILWEAIIEEFIDSIISYKEANLKHNIKVLKERQKPEYVEDWRKHTEEQIAKLKNKAFRAKLKSNSILKSVFKNYFGHLQHYDDIMPLIDIFDEIIKRNLLSKFDEVLDQEYLRVSEKRRFAFFETEEEGKRVLNEHIESQIGKEGLEDYEIFEELLDQIGYADKFEQTELFTEYLPSDVYRDLASEEKLNERLEKVFNPESFDAHYSRSEVAEANKAVLEIVDFLKTLSRNEKEDRKRLIPFTKKIARQFGAIDLHNDYSTKEVLRHISPRAMIDLYMRKDLDDWVTEVLVTLLCEYPFYLLGKYGRSGLSLREADKTFLRDLWAETRLYRVYK